MEVFLLVGLTGLTSFHFVAPALIALTATAILSSRFRLWSNQLLAGSSPMLSHSRHKKNRHKGGLCVLALLTGLLSKYFSKIFAHSLRQSALPTGVFSSAFVLWSNQLLAGSSPMLSHSRHKKTAIKAVFVSWSD